MTRRNGAQTPRDSGRACRQARELLSLYAEGELDGAREAQVSAHLAACPACRERAALDRELAGRLAAFMPAEGLAARRRALRGKVMAEIEKERRRQPWRRAALQFGNAATWAMMLAVTGALVLASAVTWRPLAERAWPASEPATPAPAGIGWQVVKDEVIADYYWAVDGVRADRTPQLSPDGAKIAYLPTVDGGATDIDRLVVRDLGSGKDLDLTPEEGYSYTSVRWSPGSKTLAFVKHRGDASYPTQSELWRVDADGGNLARLYAAQDEGVAETRGRGLVIDGWSADGRYIDVQVTAPLSSYMGCQRVRSDGSGSEERAYPTAADLGVEEGAPVGREVFSPAGDFLLHAVKTAGLLQKPEGAPADGQSLVLYDFESKRATVLGSFPDAMQIGDGGVSPDGEWISFSTSGKVWVVRRDGTGLRVTLPASMPGPVWAAGGRAYFNQPPAVSAIWISALDAASGESELIPHRFPARDLVSASRDGRRLLIIRGEGQSAQLCLLTLAPKPAPTPEPATAQPQFGAPRDLLTPPPSAGFYRISPDGQWVVYPVPGTRTAMGDLPPHLEADSIADGQMQTIALFAPDVPGGLADAQATWFPDSQRLLVVTSGEGGQILVKTLGSEPAQTLARAPQGSFGFGEAAISPGGWEIAYTVLYPDGPAPVPKAGLEAMNADGSGRHQVVAPENFIGRLAWATGPGGANLFFFKGEGGTPPEGGKMYEVGVGVGAAPALPQPVAEGMRAVAWSPANTFALWLGEPADAQGKADLALSVWPPSGEPQVVAHDVAATSVAWAGSEHWFVYGKDGALYLAENGGRERLVRLTPEGEQAGAPVWAPGMGLIYEAIRDGFATLRLLPSAGGNGEPTERDTAGLTVEEHDVTTVGTGFPNSEGSEWIGPKILDVRRAWREPAPAEKVAATNEALRSFGLRLEPKEKPGWGRPFYDLYKGDRLVVGDLDTVWPVAVSAAGDDFALLVEPLNGHAQLIRPTGSEEWDGSQHQYQPPVFVGRDLVSVTGIAELSNVTVVRGRLPVYTAFVVWPPASYPVKGLWSWQGHWVLEASGRVVMDGKDLNRELGYDEIFGYRLLKGRPFYFFKQGGRVGVSYNGLTLPQQYDEVRHYGCCSAAAYNPGGNDTMTWFFGLRDGTWYYVEMGRYGGEDAPAAAVTAHWEATVELQPLDASGGALYGRLTLTNRSTEARTLRGRPQATIADANGEIVPTIMGEGRDDGGSRPITVPPGEQAVAQIFWANYCGQAPPEPLALQLVLPGPEAVQLSVPLKLVGGLPRCIVEAPASTLTVGAFEPGEAPPAGAPAPGTTQAAFSTFLPAATAYLERTTVSPEASSAEAVVARDLQALMREHGLAPLYVQRSQGELEAWVGAGVAGAEAEAFLLWRQGERVAYQLYGGEHAYSLYLVNRPQALRLVERDGALEIGLITAPIGSTGDVWFMLLRLADGKWAELWSPVQAPAGSWQSGAPSSVEFGGPGIDSLQVVGPIPTDVPASRVFFEFGAYLKQSYESAWQRQGNGYVRVSGRILPTPLTALAGFIAALQKGDRAGAAALATDPAVADAALALGLGIPASGEGWLATEEGARTGGAERLRFFDSGKRDRSYAATLMQQGGKWRLSGVEPVQAAGATPAPQQGPGAFRALHMADAQSGWALAGRGILRTSDGGATWADVTPPDATTPAGDSEAYWAGPHFLDADHAWVAVSRGQETTVLRTTDGGRNWQSSLLPVEGMSAQFSFVDARRGWALVHQGGAAGSEGVAVLGTLDGGATWTVFSVADPQSPQPGQVPFAGSKVGISFRDVASGWLALFEPVSGKFFLYATHDGGRTWAEQTLALPAGYEEAQATPEAPVFFNAQEGVLAVGVWRHEPGRLFYSTRDGGATWTPAPPIDAAVGGTVVSEFVSADAGWALVMPVPGETRKLELRHTADGGRTWTVLTSDPALEGVTALEFVDSQRGWAVRTGEESTYLLRTTDGGRTWVRVG